MQVVFFNLYQEGDIVKESFVFYRSFYKALKKLDNKDLKSDIYDAICELALNENSIEINDNLGEIIMDLIRPQIIANNERYSNGKKGGRPLKNHRLSKEKTIGYEKKKPNDNENVNDNVNIKEKNIIKKEKFGEYGNVLLTEKELQSLKSDYINYQDLIKYLDEYIEMKGYKAKSHYLCIKRWVIDAVNKNSNSEPKWFNEKIQNNKLTKEEEQEFKNILEEFK